MRAHRCIKCFILLVYCCFPCKICAEWDGARASDARRCTQDAGEELSSEVVRFRRYQRTVCAKCKSRSIDCGCLPDSEFDPEHGFGLLREYMALYEHWREAIQQQQGDFFAMKFVAVELKNGLGNQLLAFVNSLLVAICLQRPLLVDRQTDYRYQDFGKRHSSSGTDEPAAWSGEEGDFDPVIDFVSHAEVQKISPMATRYLFMDQPGDVHRLLCDLSAESFDDVDVLAIGNSNEDPHMILDNPACPHLRAAFRGVPFFFLSHFLWSGASQRSRPVPIASLPSPRPWDGLRTVADFHAELRSKGLLSVAVHVRIAGNNQFHHFDHSHLLPDPSRPPSPSDLASFCTGHPSSLRSVHRCVVSTLAGLASPSAPAVLLWATDNSELSAPLLQDLAALEGVHVVLIAHGEETSNGLASGMIDLEFLAGADRFVGTPQSTYSFSAHARGLLVPKYGSFAPHGRECAVGNGPEAGLLSRGPLMHRCWQQGWNLTCRSLSDDCLALVSGHPRLGECLQHLGHPCRSEVGGSWAAEYLVDLRQMDFTVQYWARHGGVIDYEFESGGQLPVCWPAPGMRSLHAGPDAQ